MLSQDVTPTTGGAGFKVDPIGTGAAVIRLELRKAGIDPLQLPRGLFGELAEHCLRRAKRIAAVAPGTTVAGAYVCALEGVAAEVAATFRREQRLV